MLIHKISYKFPNYGIQKKTFSSESQTILEFEIPIVGNFMFSNLENIRKTLHILGNEEYEIVDENFVLHLFIAQDMLN